MISLAEERDFQLGAWTVSPSAGELRRDDRCVRLEPRTMRVLVALVRAEGATVSRDTLMKAAWGRLVSEESVNGCIKELRRALGDDAGTVIATVPKIGYRISISEAPRPARPSRRRLHWSVAGAAAVAAAATGALSLAFRPAAWTGEVSAFTTDPGADVSPAFDPSGRLVAFVAQPEGGEIYKIRVRALGAAASLPLTDGPGNDRADDLAPAWSPNGQSLAFIQESEGEPCRLMIQHYPGGAPHEFYRCKSEAFPRLTWLRDGSGVVFPERADVASPYRLVAVGLDGFRRELTTPTTGSRGDIQPAASPDGRSIAFGRCAGIGVCDLFDLDLASGRLRRLTSDAALIRGIDWSDNSRTIFFSTQRDGPSAIWAMPAAGGRPAKVVPGLVNVNAITQSHNRIVAQVERMRANLFAIDRHGALEALADGSSRIDFAPAFAPDGALAFMSNRAAVQDIWIRASGAPQSRRAAHPGAAVAACPSWSPDGRQIAFLGGGPDGLDIAIVSANGGEARRLTHAAALRLYPSWSRDGRYIYFSSDPDGRGWRIWRVATNGAAVPEPLTEPGWRLGRESPDGRWFYAVKLQTPGLWRRPIEGGRFERFVTALRPDDAASWAADGDRLVYVARPGAVLGGPANVRVSQTSLVSRAVSTGAEQIVAPLPDDALNYFSCYGLAIRPDGAVVFSRALNLQSDLDTVELRR